MAAENGKTNTGVKGSDTPAGELKTAKYPRTRTTSDGGTTTGTTGGNNNTGKTEKEKPVGVAPVEIKPEPNETIPAPDLKKAKKPRTRKKTVKKNDEAFNSEQISALLLTVSTILSTSERGKIFALSELEAKQLSEPLAKIIANNDSMKALTEHSDSVALTMTAFMIFAPKFFLWLQYEKAHKKPKGVEVKTIKGVKQNERKAENGVGGTAGGNAPKNTDSSIDINDIIPSIL